MTATEKILAKAAGRDHVEPGEILTVRVDGLALSDLGAPQMASDFKSIGAKRVFDPSRVYIILDHDVPASNTLAADNANAARSFAREFGLRLFDIGRNGIVHVLVPEEGLALPGEVFVAFDSHTTTHGGLGAFATGINGWDVVMVLALGELWLRVPETTRFVYHGTPDPWVSAKDLVLRTIGQIGTDGARYQAMEFTGPAIDALPVSGRLTICNMAIEAGAKNGIIPGDAVTDAYCRPRATRPYQALRSDPDARFAAEVEIDCTGLRPQVARPSSPGNVVPVDEVAGQAVDQVFIGSCTNGRIEDLRVVAAIMRGRQVHPEVRCIVIPGSHHVFKQALAEGLVAVLAEAGCAIGPTTCGPCYGGHMGIAGASDRVVSTSNRNFRGRMGHPDAQVYLSSPAVAATAAVLGRLAAPEEVMGRAVVHP